LNAAEWHIDPHKIGVLGFSAGGHLVAAISNHFEQRVYPAVDAADKESCRPDFAVAVYPGHLSLHAAEWDAKQGTKRFVIPHLDHQSIADAYLALNPDLHVTSRTPPTFLLQAEDDHVDSVYDSLAYFVALQKAGVPAEMHLYPHGGHAFGLRQTELPITEWPQLVEDLAQGDRNNPEVGAQIHATKWAIASHVRFSSGSVLCPCASREVIAGNDKGPSFVNPP